jgi:hypothetical protein
VQKSASFAACPPKPRAQVGNPWFKNDLGIQQPVFLSRLFALATMEGRRGDRRRVIRSAAAWPLHSCRKIVKKNVLTIFGIPE